MGMGGFTEGPKDCAAYRRGYLCGMIRGDAHLGRYSYPYGDVHQSRLALADTEALSRTRYYLGTSAVQAIQHLISWPTDACSDWYKGFLAGIFDAEGSYSGAWRVRNTDPEIIARTTHALSAFGFRVRPGAA